MESLASATEEDDQLTEMAAPQLDMANACKAGRDDDEEVDDIELAGVAYNERSRQHFNRFDPSRRSLSTPNILTIAQHQTSNKSPSTTLVTSSASLAITRTLSKRRQLQARLRRQTRPTSANNGWSIGGTVTQSSSADNKDERAEKHETRGRRRTSLGLISSLGSSANLIQRFNSSACFVTNTTTIDDVIVANSSSSQVNSGSAPSAPTLSVSSGGWRSWFSSTTTIAHKANNNAGQPSCQADLSSGKFHALRQSH